MKTVKELRDKITDDDGKLMVGSVRLEYGGGESDVDIFPVTGGAMIGWVTGESNSLLVKSVHLANDALEHFKELSDFAQFIGLDTGIEPITVEKTITKEDPEKDRLKGMVDAYEKIVLGRQLTVGQ